VFALEDFLPTKIGRPSAVAPVIPAGDSPIGSGSQRNAIGHLISPFDIPKDTVLIFAIFRPCQWEAVEQERLQGPDSVP
jgi:hypothetical protein